MPLLGALLVSLFGGIAGFIAQYFGKKATVGIALVATLATITGGLLLVMRAAIAAIVPIIGDGNFAVGVGIAIPSNFSSCMAAIVSTWTACTLYSWKREALKLFAQA
jgi:hypothetical protein